MVKRTIYSLLGLLALVASLGVTTSTALAQPAGSGADDPSPLLRAPDAPKTARPLLVDRVVAQINEEILLQSELNLRVIPLLKGLDEIADPAERKRRMRVLFDQTLSDMVNEELVYQAAVEAKMEIDAKQVEKLFDEMRKQNKMPEEQFVDFLKQAGHTKSSYKRYLKKQQLRFQAVQHFVTRKLVVTDDAAKARYEQMHRRSGAVGKVHLHRILVALPPKPAAGQLRAAREKAARIITMVRAGADFRELARKLSDDSVTAAEGGDMGMVERSDLDKQLRDIVFSMGKGDVRGPIATDAGLVVLYAVDIVKAGIKPFAELKAKIKQDLQREKFEKRTQQWLAELRKNAYIVTSLR